MQGLLGFFAFKAVSVLVQFCSEMYFSTVSKQTGRTPRSNRRSPLSISVLPRWFLWGLHRATRLWVLAMSLIISLHLFLTCYATQPR